MKSTRKNRRSAPPVTPQEALEMLASVVNVCREAGLAVRTGNDGTLGLVLALPDAHVEWAGSLAKFCPGKPRDSDLLPKAAAASTSNPDDPPSPLGEPGDTPIKEVIASS